MTKHNIDSAIEQFLDQLSIETLSRAKELAPVDKGHLRQHTKLLDKRAGQRVIGTDKIIYYAKWVYYGTRPHTIKPKRKKALKTPYGVYKKVKHPGTKPNPYLENALAQLVANGTFARIVDDANFPEGVANELGLDKFAREWSK